MTLKLFFNLLSQASVFLPLIAGWTVFKKLPPPFRLFFYFIIFSLIAEIQARITNIVYNNNMPGMHIFTWVEFIIFSVFYALYFKRSKHVRGLIGINILVGTVVGIVNAVYVGGIMSPNVISRSYYAFFITLYTLYFFYLLFKSDGSGYEWLTPMSWIATGALVYFANNIGYFLFREYWYIKFPKVAGLSYFLHSVINIFSNCLFARAFLCFRK